MGTPAGSLCGVWVDDDGRVRTTVATASGRREEKVESLRPFAWLNDAPPETNLAGLGKLTVRVIAVRRSGKDNRDAVFGLSVIVVLKLG